MNCGTLQTTPNSIDLHIFTPQTSPAQTMRVNVACCTTIQWISRRIPHERQIAVFNLEHPPFQTGYDSVVCSLSVQVDRKVSLHRD